MPMVIRLELLPALAPARHSQCHCTMCIVQIINPGSVWGRVCSDRVCFTALQSFNWISRNCLIVEHEHSSSAAATIPIRQTGLTVLLSENGLNSSSQHGVRDQSMLLLGRFRHEAL